MRDLTTPITKINANKQYISEGRYKLVLAGDGSIDQDKSFYQYVVTSLPSGEYTAHRIYLSSIPPTFRAQVKNVHQMVVTHAEAQGILKPGIDTDDL